VVKAGQNMSGGGREGEGGTEGECGGGGAEEGSKG